ncbi:MAG: alpha/beta fold hydrolase [Acidimicrobiales bacterium]
MRYLFAGHDLDVGARELRRAGSPVHLERQAFDVLVYLVENRDRVVTKTELLEAVWDTEFVSESNLSSRIKDARRAVGDDGKRQGVIRTSHGYGYRFVADVETVVGADPQERDGAGPEREVTQQIRFCRSHDDVNIAMATSGSGPPLVKAANWLTHLDYDWDSPAWRHWLAGLSAEHTLIRYDERGCGLSDWDTDNFSLGAWVSDLECVVDAAGLERFPLLGMSQGAAVAIAYAVRHPDRVSHLVLFGGFAAGRAIAATSDAERDEARTLIDLARVGWGLDDPAFLQVFASRFAPDGTREQWEAFTELQRRTTSAQNAVRFLEQFSQLDVRHLAEQVETPTLVLHSRDEREWPVRFGHELAQLIPHSRFVALESNNHLLQEDEPAWQRFLDELDRFLANPSTEVLP